MNNKNFQLFLLVTLLICFGISIYQKHEQAKVNVQPPWMSQPSWKPLPEEPSKEEVKPEKIVPPSSYQEALTVAGQTGKDILIIFHSPGCHWCEKLQNETLSNSSVINKMSKYVIYMLNTSSEPEISKKYKISGVPAYKIIDSKETIKLSGAGFKSPTEFNRWLDSI